MRRHSQALEDDFVVATLDQRGTGTSYDQLDPTDTMTLDEAVADAVAVTDYLRERFDEEIFRENVRRLHAAASGNADLGLATPPDLIRVRFLDPDLAPGGLRDVSAPTKDLAGLAIAPRAVFVFENLETVVAMPGFDGAVAVHGSGYAVDRLGSLPWVRGASVIYWGDLDSHGFAILNRLRSHGVDARSVLMDAATLDSFADLCVPEPNPSTARLEYLTSEELGISVAEDLLIVFDRDRVLGPLPHAICDYGCTGGWRSR